ncbi:hypothetical protein QNO07_18080 [Streptomyces sp. 549]|uniref:hypothetical protein n=1 Tax=Streptomyces sp. 549 TaxID=3049076 RepID=UPI0024C288A1|nr:hypothetical protein [Streptomyces sp. 549]MDK1475304.1 hypothetical protein [Streptomyces sp. 549]
MKARKSLAGSVIAAAVLSMGVIGTTPAAAAPGDTVASCVKTRAFNQASDYTVQVRNTCKKAVKIKVVMRLGRDHPCTTIKAGKLKHFSSNSLGTWKKTVYC